MITRIKLSLANGYYEIKEGTDFAVISEDADHLVYEENGIWNVVSQPGGVKGGNSIITVPPDAVPYAVYIEGENIGLNCDFINTQKLFLDMKSSACEINNVSSGKIKIEMGRGDMRISASEFSNLHINCGYGNIVADLYGRDLYNITTKCGNGEIILNSRRLPRGFCENNDGNNINIICGMGRVEVNTYNIKK